MLKWEEFSVKETAFAVGYNNELNFSTEFKRIVGFSPTQYRMHPNPESLMTDFIPLSTSENPGNDIVI